MNNDLILATIFILVLLIAPLQSTMAQDSARKEDTPIENKFNRLKLINVQFDGYSSSDYHLKSDKQRYEEGNIGRRNFKANLDIPLLIKSTFAVSVSGNYNYGNYHFRDMKMNPVAFNYLNHDSREEFNYFSTTATFTYFGKLWGKKVVYSANLVADGSHGYESVTGLFAGTILLRKDKVTSMSVGLYATTSQASIIPFFPIFTYIHKFEGSPWTVDVIVPHYAYMRRFIGRNGRLSAGALIDSNTFYVYPRQVGFKNKYTFNRIDLKAEVLYEHHLLNGIIANARFGISKCYKGALREKNKQKNIVEFNQDAVGYFNVGVSYQLK